LKYADCLLAGDGIETNKRKAEHYLRCASEQNNVKAHMRYGIVLLSGQLGRFGINRAIIEFRLAAEKHHFGSLPFDALSQP
jgi:TPR repeat protein